MRARPLVSSPDLLPSVLDRLLDDSPHEPPGRSRAGSDLSDFKAALARDLESLLNTRNSACVDDSRYPLTARSVLTFGTPDQRALGMPRADQRETLRLRVHHAIAVHEPRLTHLRVSLEHAHDDERRLRFRVDAVLHVAPFREPVVFDATLDLSSSAYRVAR